MRAVRAFMRLSRPHFLLGGLLLFAVGAATAEVIVIAGYAIGQVMVTSTQLTAQYVNEYADVEADLQVADRTWFSGGSGVLPSGALPRSVALQAAWVSSAVAVAATAAMVPRSVPVALIGLVALGAAWSYSMPPIRLLGTGWGELVASVVVAGLVPLVGALAQEAAPSDELWWAVAILVPIHLAMMVAFELPDREGDTAAGKRVLAVRLKLQASRRLIGLLLIVAAATVVVAGATEGLPPQAALATLAAVPPAVVLVGATYVGRAALLTTSAVATLVMVAGGLIVGLTR